MRRVLVPLDGSQLAASILPDARRVAGPDGTLILVRNAEPPIYARGVARLDTFSVDVAYDYLNGVAEQLEADGVNVETHVLVFGHTAFAVDEAAAIYRADMIAVATHGRSPLGRLVHGGVAFKAIAHSAVPVLLRHPDHPVAVERITGPRRIMVPLDGSQYAERAVSLACRLAVETSGEIVLVQVVPNLSGSAAVGAAYGGAPITWSDSESEVETYLNRIAETLPCHVQTLVLVGPVSSRLIEVARRLKVTDVVMTSHGRTGLSRVVLGSVTDDLIQHLHCPIVVLPVLVAEKVEEPKGEPNRARAHSHGAVLSPIV